VELVSKRSNLIKKVFISLLALMILTFSVGEVISHQFNLESANTAHASLKAKIKSNNEKQLEDTVNDAGESIVDFTREVAIVVSVLVLIWMGYSLFIKRSAEGLADMKGRMGGLIVALAFVFFTEQILGAIFGIFGVKI